jgi:FkbM family methyltransferase
MPGSLYYLFRRFAKLFSGSGLRARYQWIDLLYKSLNRRLAPRSTIVLGHQMYLDPGDSMGLSLDHVYEPLETLLVQNYVKPGQVVLDIGANIGYYTLIFANLVGTAGRVYAFEPDPYSFETLKRNVTINGYRNVILEQKAVSNQNAQVRLGLDNFNNLDHRIISVDDKRRSVNVDVVRLDDYFLGGQESVDFIKMDIQGAEGLALYGMQSLLARSRAVTLLTEFWMAGLESSGVGALKYLLELKKFGFQIYDVGVDLYPKAEVEPMALLEQFTRQPMKHTNLLCYRQPDR